MWEIKCSSNHIPSIFWRSLPFLNVIHVYRLFPKSIWKINPTRKTSGYILKTARILWNPKTVRIIPLICSLVRCEINKSIRFRQFLTSTHLRKINPYKTSMVWGVVSTERTFSCIYDSVLLLIHLVYNLYKCSLSSHKKPYLQEMFCMIAFICRGTLAPENQFTLFLFKGLSHVEANLRQRGAIFKIASSQTK